MALSSETSAVAAQETDGGTVLGRNADSKIAFFGGTPVVKNAAAFDLSSGTVAELAAILAAYGLITTQA